ncbi:MULTISPECIES: YveK family protein [Clostridium]|uniref:Lipopolysaccharide biosynthesis protein n=3 Tax=Clostridium butyricum TaxID=1492 RepID=C4ID99_CLOBU|nr:MULTISPECIES: Wzz/FepE/Etk N-terminal domain-containing protein [Clostridium]APF24336.1 chain length determinant family protein [Clostridium butyricum]AXB83685.1 capsular biosynthesis protein [Clostridium butyricum]EDT76683.1 capsular polysaccharide biosynthsis protein [Clostridium butyricum 5521]EEP55787.1 lipopolysaccharide biosynthesis protein [Clostridium butyricum E4 str. BoNT E BL5262]KQB78941.1 capsular biosynthesis protein [Clostridium butyricum]
MNEEIIRIEDIVDVLTKRWKMIFSVTLVATLISAVVSFFLIAPKYQAGTKLFIGKENTTTQDQSYNNNDVQMYQKLLKTYAEVIQTKDLVGQAIEQDNLDLDPEDVLKNLTVTPRADTQILEISYINVDPVVSQKIVESVTDKFIEYSTELIPNGNVKIIESVRIPENAVSPNKKMNIAIAFLLGLMISVGLSFLIEFMDNTFKTKEQIENILDLPAIGVIPNELNFE